MITRKLIAGSFFLIPHITIAQNSLTGNIRYRDDNSPAPYVNVTLSGQNAKPYTAVCDEKGQFKFSDVPAGSYLVQVTYFEHDTLTQTIVITDGEQLNTSLFIKQPKWVKDMKQSEIEKARQDSIEYSNRKYRAKRHQPKY